jgi:hypothetical protein
MAANGLSTPRLPSSAVGSGRVGQCRFAARVRNTVDRRAAESNKSADGARAHPQIGCQLHRSLCGAEEIVGASRLADPRPETAPSDAGDGAEVVNAALGIIRVVNEHRSAAKVRARHGTVVPTVDGIVPVIAHHEEGAAGHDEWPPLMQAWSRHGRAESRAANFHLMLPREDRLRFIGGGIRKTKRVGRRHDDAVDRQPRRMRSVSPATPTMRLTSVGVTSSGAVRIVTSCGGETKTVISPRVGRAYPG